MNPIHSALRIARETGGTDSPEVPKVHAPKVKPVGPHHEGPINSSVAGRTDHLPVTVESGSYVLPADIVSHAGENNTAAGFKVLKRMFSGLPRSAGDTPYAGIGVPTILDLTCTT